MRTRTPTLDGTAALHDAVREHYDRLSGQYLRQWGEHIHHGLFDGPAPTPAAAQQRLVEHLAARAAIARGSRVLDVGCGFGGSTRWLAERLQCRVLGLTISPVQARTALRLTTRRGLAGRAAFALADAERLPCAPASVDAVWVVECSEHLADKAAFLTACARTLRPGGVLALCAWLAPDDCAPGQREPLAALVEAMVCPSLGSWRDYEAWIAAAPLELALAEDLTARVAPTWDHCAAAVRKPLVRAWLATQPRSVRRFAAAVGAMRAALEARLIRHGLFVARRAAVTIPRHARLPRGARDRLV